MISQGCVTYSLYKLFRCPEHMKNDRFDAIMNLKSFYTFKTKPVEVLKQSRFKSLIPILMQKHIYFNFGLNTSKIVFWLITLKIDYTRLNFINPLKNSSHVLELDSVQWFLFIGKWRRRNSNWSEQNRIVLLVVGQ